MLISRYVLGPHECFRTSSQGVCGLSTIFIHLGLCSIFIDEVSQWFPLGQTLGSLISCNTYQKKLFHVRTNSGFSETLLWALISFLLKSSSMEVWYRVQKWSADKTCGHSLFLFIHLLCSKGPSLNLCSVFSWDKFFLWKSQEYHLHRVLTNQTTGLSTSQELSQF